MEHTYQDITFVFYIEAPSWFLGFWKTIRNQFYRNSFGFKPEIHFSTGVESFIKFWTSSPGDDSSGQGSCHETLNFQTKFFLAAYAAQ